MGTHSIGRVLTVFKGHWDKKEEYKKLDLVIYHSKGWWCLEDTEKGESPRTNPSKWGLCVDRTREEYTNYHDGFLMIDSAHLASYNPIPNQPYRNYYIGNPFFKNGSEKESLYDDPTYLEYSSGESLRRRDFLTVDRLLGNVVDTLRLEIKKEGTLYVTMREGDGQIRPSQEVHVTEGVVDIEFERPFAFNSLRNCYIAIYSTEEGVFNVYYDKETIDNHCGIYHNYDYVKVGWFNRGPSDGEDFNQCGLHLHAQLLKRSDYVEIIEDEDEPPTPPTPTHDGLIYLRATNPSDNQIVMWLNGDKYDNQYFDQNGEYESGEDINALPINDLYFDDARIEEMSLNVASKGDLLYIGSSQNANLKSVEIKCVPNQNLNEMHFESGAIERFDVDNNLNVTYLNRTFYRNQGLTSFDLNKIVGESTTTIVGIFQQATNLQEVTLPRVMPQQCQNAFTLNNSLERVIIDENTDFSKVTNLYRAFYVTRVTDFNAGFGDFRNCTDFREMFYGDMSLTSASIGEMREHYPKHMERLFYGCGRLKSVSLGEGFGYFEDSTDGMFDSCHNLTTIEIKSTSIACALNFDECPLDAESVEAILRKLSPTNPSYLQLSETTHFNIGMSEREDEILALAEDAKANGWTINL